jgi:hypothetical protein
LLDDARERTLALQARAAALAELVERDARPLPSAHDEAPVALPAEHEALTRPPE